MEDNVKRYELKAVEERLRQQETLGSGIDAKLDKIIENLITPQYLDQRLELQRMGFEARMSTVEQAVKPLIEGDQWRRRFIITSLVGSIISAIFTIGTIVLNTIINNRHS